MPRRPEVVFRSAQMRMRTPVVLRPAGFPGALVRGGTGRRRGRGGQGGACASASGRGLRMGPRGSRAAARAALSGRGRPRATACAAAGAGAAGGRGKARCFKARAPSSMPRAAAAGAAMFRPPSASAVLAAGCAALIIAAPSNPIDGSHSAMLAGPFRMATAIRWSFEDSSAATQANSTGVIAGATIATCGACIFWTDFTGKLLRVPAEPTDCGVDSDDPAIAIAPCIELDLSISNGDDDATGAQELSSYSQVPQVRSFDPAVFSGMSSLATLNLGTEYPVAELPETLFRGLGALSSLQFQFHSLASIPEGLFAGLANLTFLGLRENSLSTIPAGSFTNLSKLEYISLRSNGLREVPAGLFDGLSELRELDLMSNTFTELPEGIFDDLVKLEYLRAPNNNLRSMPKQAFKNLGALTWLGLKVNLFQDMPADFLTGLTSLRVLDLSDCWPLGTLPPGFFEPAPNIRALYLARSQITSLPEGIWDPLTDLRVMNLQGNAEDFW